jgi:hypothetical protein
MQKVTLTFPNPDSLWLFKDRSKAINVAVAPAKNRMTGLFSSEEINIALTQFQAVKAISTSTNANASSFKHTETRTEKPPFRFRFSQLLSLMNL